MKVYTATELMELLHVGKPTALAIMKSHGFQVGYTKLSPYRITEEQLTKYAEDMKNERGKPSRVTTHRGYGTRLYRIWSGMKTRCNNPNCRIYMRYGGRGITICDEWRRDFSTFREWAISNGYSEELTLDRINNDEGYSPENCRWATTKEQNRNRRDNRLLTLNGNTKPLAEWAEIAGLNIPTLHKRVVKLGWSLEKAMTTPLWGDPDREPNWSQMKAVHQCDKDGNILATFESVTEASRVTKISRCNISSVLHGKRRIAGGYYWKFVKEGSMNSEFV